MNIKVLNSSHPYASFKLVLFPSIYERSLVLLSAFTVLPVISLLAVPRRLFCFGSLVILDVARCYLW